MKKVTSAQFSICEMQYLWNGINQNYEDKDDSKCNIYGSASIKTMKIRDESKCNIYGTVKG
jgi:hypothetical protein